MKIRCAVLLLVLSIAWAVTDFAPHNMTTNTAPTPYVASASSEYSASFLASKAFNGDGGTTNWVGSGGALGDVAPRRMTGASTPSPYVISGSTCFFACINAFDGVGGGSNWLGNGGGVDYLQVDLGTGNAKTIVSYAIQVNTVPEPNRAPKNWTLKGSNDNVSFTVIDTVTNSTSWSSGETRVFQCDDVSTAYRYLQLNITANNGDATYTQVSNLFLSTLALTVAGAGVDYLELDLGSGNAQVLGSYDVQVNTIPEASRGPKNWVVQGSNDNSNWSTVSTVTNQTSWTSGQIRSFTCTVVTTAYRYFRVYVTANNTDTYTQIAELFLYQGTVGVRHRIYSN